MAAMAIPGEPPNQAAKNNWITPQEQLRRLQEPLMVELAGTREKPGVLPVDSVATLVAEYVGNSSTFTNWHKALFRLNMLPEKMPPLPQNIHQVADSICPIWSGKTKPDGTPYKLGETHSIYYVPPGTMSELEARGDAYGKQHLITDYGLHPLRFIMMVGAARRDHWNTRSQGRWIWFLNDVLEESRNKNPLEQTQMVEALSAKSGVAYRMPSLKEVTAFSFFHKSATGEPVLGEKQPRRDLNFTHVVETCDDGHLQVGTSTPIGMVIHENLNVPDNSIGVMPVRDV